MSDTPRKWISKPTSVQFVTLETGQKVSWALKYSKVPEIWKETKGEGVKVGIVDADIIDHPDINANIVKQASFTPDMFPVNGNGHGVFVAGVVGAVDNARGVVGAAPCAQLYIYKALSNDGGGTDEWIADAVNAAVEDGVHIINMSLGSSYPCPKTYQAIKRANKKGILVICAAGNDGNWQPGSTVNYPAKYPPTVASTSIKHTGEISDFSSGGDEVDIAAGGEAVISTYVTAEGEPTTAILDGTSFSSPLVTGIAACCLSKHILHGGETPVDTPSQLKEHLLRTADDKGEIGKDRLYGYGVVNAERAIFEKGEKPNEDPPKKEKTFADLLGDFWRAICNLFVMKKEVKN